MGIIREALDNSGEVQMENESESDENMEDANEMQIDFDNDDEC